QRWRPQGSRIPAGQFRGLRPAQRPRLGPRGGAPGSAPVTGRPGFEALAPFFRIIGEGLSGLVDGEDFFDTLAEDAIFEYVISVPGYPRRIAGREAVAELYHGYGQTIVLHGSDELAVHRD